MSNADTVRAYLAAIDSDHAEEARRLFAPDFVFTTPFGTVTDIDEQIGFSKGFAQTFPDMTHAIDRCWEVGDVVVVQGTWTGTQTGPMTLPDGTTFPASGKQVTFPYSVIVDVEAGLMKHVRAYFDSAAFLALVPAPAGV